MSETGATSHEVNVPPPPGPESVMAPPPPPPAPHYPADAAVPIELFKIRSTGMCVLLTIVTLGFYPIFWYYGVHNEMKRHSGQGLGGGLALVLAIFAGFVMPFVTSSEIGNLYKAKGSPAPVSGVTGLWYLPGFLIIVGPLIWFIKTNEALNPYWRSVGAR